MDDVKISSNKSFGLVFFIFFIIIAFYPLINQGEIRIWSVLISLLFLILGVINSKILTPLNKVWFKFGIFLGKFIAPIVMGIVYFTVVFPTFLLLKLFKKNYLNIKYERNTNSYWIKIQDKNTTMKDQF